MTKFSRISLAGLVLLGLIGCTSRYTYDLYQTTDETRRKVKVESTQFIPNRLLGDPNAVEKFIPGHGNSMVITTGTRGTTREAEAYTVFRWDEYLICDLFIQLPPAITPTTVQLMDNSYLWIRGRYEQPASSRLFRPESGQMVIDSVRGDKLYASIDGVFRNGDKQPIQFDGKFKVKVSK